LEGSEYFCQLQCICIHPFALAKLANFIGPTD